MAMVTVLGPPVPGLRRNLRENGVVLLGREDGCDVLLKKRSISRRHARIRGSSGNYYLEDLQSTNGTYLNGRRLADATRLQDGDVFHLHNVPLSFAAEGIATPDDEPTLNVTAAGVAPTILDTDDLFAPLVGAPGATILRCRLDSLVEIARQIGSNLDPAETPQRLLDLLFRMFPQATLGVIHLLSNREELSLAAERLAPERASRSRTAPIDPALVHAVWESGRGRLQGVTQDDRCGASLPTAACVCVPIIGLTHTALGVLQLHTDDALHPFSRDDLELATAVGVLAGQAIEFTRAHQLLIRHEQTAHHLQTAREIQLGMLPRARPTIAQYAFTDRYAPAEVVGGDFYFYEQLSPTRALIGIADASGKGLAAAMTIARFAGEVRSRLVAAKTLKTAMKELNRFVADVGTTTFITCCVCVLDGARHTVTVANAGHLPPLVRRARNRCIETLSTPRGAPPFGIDPDAVCHPMTYSLLPGDTLMLFTDGLTEAMDPADELYGETRLHQTLLAATDDLEAITSLVIAEIDRFRQDRLPSDDLCLLGIQRQPE